MTSNTNAVKPQAGSMIAVGLGLAAVGFAGRYALRRIPNVADKINQAIKTLPTNYESMATSRYYKGGFEGKMSKREASLILGVSPTANTVRVKVGLFFLFDGGKIT